MRHLTIPEWKIPNKPLQRTYEYLDNALTELWQTLYEKENTIPISNKEQYPTNLFIFNMSIKIDGKRDPEFF